MKDMKTTEYSVVVPVMNEEGNVRLLYDKIKHTMDGMGAPYEIIFVDDGSTDSTYSTLECIKDTDPNLKVVKFRTNFGQSAAMAAGFDQACGNIVISMDGDLQNDPKDIPALVHKMREGYDIVAGWRKDRKDKLLLRKIPSMIANRIIRSLTGVHLHDTGCSLKVYRREVIKKISLYGELHRFIPVLGRIAGARIAEMVVSHHPRRFGESKYNLTRTFKVIMDLITLNFFIKYLTRPMHFFGMLGFWFNLIGTSALLVSGYLFLDSKYNLTDLNVLLAFSFLLLTSGCQLVFYGLIANMVVRTGERHDSKLIEYYSSSLSREC